MLKEASDAAIASLAESARVRSLARGEAFLREGIQPDSFGVLLSGHVRAVHFNPEGRPITLMVGWAGSAVALMTLLANRPAQADIEAAEPTRIAIVTRTALERVLAEEPRLALSLLSECTRQLFDVMGVVKLLSVDVVARVASHILARLPYPSERLRTPIKVDLGTSRIELAAELGTVPETLSRAFSVLQDSGAISSHGRTVMVLDLEALKSRAAGDLPE